MVILAVTFAEHLMHAGTVRAEQYSVTLVEGGVRENGVRKAILRFYSILNLIIKAELSIKNGRD